MNLNFKKARDLMVKNQLLPNKINNHDILELFKNTKKENFLTENLKEISYSDIEINLEANRGYLNNLHIAQLIHKADVKEQHKVLHIGGMTGYVSVMLSKLSKELIVIENNKKLLTKLKENIANLDINNIKIINSSFHDGHDQESPYDIIFIDNPIKKLSSSIKDQLSSESGKIIMIKKINKYFCKAYRITKNKNIYKHEFLFDVFTKFNLYNFQTEFIF